MFGGGRRSREGWADENEHPNPLVKFLKLLGQCKIERGSMNVTKSGDTAVMEGDCVVFFSLQNRGKGNT